MFGGKRSKMISDFSDRLVFFSEGQSYWRVYEPVIRSLVAKGVALVYLTADSDDDGLSFDSEFVESHYLGGMKQSIWILNRLKATMCVMTTPQLDVIALKRSKDVKHYCHIIHSPTDIHAYKKFAFDYFDSVLCSGSFQIENLRYLEQIRGTAPKELFETGCTYYDDFKIDTAAIGNAILVAPTWGDRTFFKIYGHQIIRDLLSAGFEVIFRPHPQSWISDKNELDNLLTDFGNHDRFLLDKNTTAQSSLFASKVLICDITSGMLFDMAFAYRKPVVAINFKWKNGGYEAISLQRETAALDLVRDLGIVVDPSDCEKIVDAVKVASAKVAADDVLGKYIYNFGQAGNVAAEHIVLIYQSI